MNTSYKSLVDFVSSIHKPFDRDTYEKKLKLYNKILDDISDINTKLVEIDHQNNYYKTFNNPHRIIYDQTYMIECLIYAEIKTIEAQMKEVKSAEIEEAVKDIF